VLVKLLLLPLVELITVVPLGVLISLRALVLIFGGGVTLILSSLLSLSSLILSLSSIKDSKLAIEALAGASRLRSLILLSNLSSLSSSTLILTYDKILSNSPSRNSDSNIYSIVGEVFTYGPL